MALHLSSLRRESLATMIFLLTTLLAWICGSEAVGSLNEHRDNTIDVINAEDVFFEILHPPELEYTYKIRPAQDFGAPFNSSFSEKRIGLIPVEPSTCCETPSNADKLRDKVALVWRGDCTFYEKAAIAEDAGAKAIIIADYGAASIDDEREMPHWMDYYYIEMSSDKTISQTRDISIPAGFLLGKNGRKIRETLNRLDLEYAIINIPVNLTFASLSEYRQPPWIAL